MKKRKKKRFNILKFIVFLLILYLLYHILTYFLNIKTKNILILNNSYYTDEQIIETAGIQNYPKFFLLNKSNIIKKLKKLDLIEDVKIHKKYGFILEIDIKEKKILYYNKETKMYMCSDGEYKSLDNIYGVPTLINYIPENIEKEFVEKFKDIESSIIIKISEIEYSKTTYDEKRFMFYMTDYNNVYINIDKLSNMNKYVDIVKKLDNKKGILYLDSGNYFEIKE